MAYKRPESDYYQVRRKSLTGYGDTGLITSKTKDKRTAERMERLLEELANKALFEPKWEELLDAVVDRKIGLPKLLKAKSRGKLHALLQSLDDPLLEEAVEAFREHCEDRQVGYGLNKLLELIPPKARLSYLQDAQAITDLCRECEREKGLKRNTVHRQLRRAISMLLREEVGNHERDRIFADVRYERKDDTREVHLSPQEIKRLLEACNHYGHQQLSTVIKTALLTSADRGVLLAGDRPDGTARGLLMRDIEIYEEEDGTCSGKVHLKDNKATGRKRTVPFGDRLARELLLCAEGKDEGEPVFDLKYSQLDYRWQRVREKASLEDVRFKDLRAQTAIYAQRAGIPQATTRSVMGHRSDRMTQRYQRHEATMSDKEADDLEVALFGAPESR